MTPNQVQEWRSALISQGKCLVVTNGCFDILHRGHIEYLNKAKQTGDCLLVAVNSDASVRTLKGSQRPLVPEYDRLYALASLEAVDAVVLFTETRAHAILALIKPDVYVKGGDYSEETLDSEERGVLQKQNCRIKFLKFIKGYSTSKLIAKIKNLA